MIKMVQRYTDGATFEIPFSNLYMAMWYYNRLLATYNASYESKHRYNARFHSNEADLLSATIVEKVANSNEYRSIRK